MFVATVIINGQERLAVFIASIQGGALRVVVKGATVYEIKAVRGVISSNFGVTNAVKKAAVVVFHLALLIETSAIREVLGH